MRLLLQLAMACLLATAASPAIARSMTIDDLLRFEQWGQIAIDPTGRWLVVEKRGAYADAQDFEGDYYGRYRVSRVYVADLKSPAPARLLTPPEPGAGYVAGPVSPDGKTMVIYRMRAQRWQAGLVQIADGTAQWLPGTPELAVFGRVAQWRSNHELLILARPDNQLPVHMRFGWDATRQLPERWKRSARGEPAVTAVGSGRFFDVRLRPDDTRLMRVDTRTGASAEVASGAFLDLELSPDGRFAAVVSAEDYVQPAGVSALRDGSTLQRHNITTVDLESGKIARPCADCDVLTGLLAWSPHSGELLVFARRRHHEDWSLGQLFRIDAKASKTRAVDTHGVSPATTLTPDGRILVRADWFTGDPVVYGQGGARGRPDWYRITRSRSLNLTRGLPAAPARPLAIGTDLMFLSDGDAWRVNSAGRSQQIANAAALTPVRGRSLDTGARFDVNNPARQDGFVAVSAASDRVLRIDRRQEVLDAPPAGSRVVALADRTVVTLENDSHGASTLTVRRPGDAPTRVLALNQDFGDVEFAQVRRISAQGPDGRVISHWLYLPPGWSAGLRLPLVVIPYPGATYAVAPGKYAAGASTFYTNPQMLTAHGYAVLVPSLPRRRDGEPMAGLADQILAPVDRLVADGYVDAKRVAVWGHSYGGYAALAMATQSPRFAAIISSSGIADLVSHWGAIPPEFAVSPELGPSTNWGQGWVEGNTGMGGPPWTDPERYRRNSPLMAANRITAPVLLIQGDQDSILLGQSQGMFSALYRQGKDAELVTYWGEGHVVMNPGNVRDLYRRVLAWLDETLGFGPVSPDVPPVPSPGF